LVGAVFEPLYARAITRRNRAFDLGRGVVRLDRPVISVGNLSVGGTGKTPMVRLLVRELIAVGRRPCVAMRGYGSTPKLEADEAAAHRAAMPGVPIVAQPDRAAGLRALFATEAGAGVDCVVLDDGFQHRRLARDLDVVLIDATRDVFTGRLLPRGWLREPVSSLARAGAVVLTHAESAGEEALARQAALAARWAPGAVIAAARHEWAGLRVLDESEERVRDAAWLLGRRTMAVCAIGNPRAFVESAERACGGELAGSVVLRDHDPYAQGTIARVIDAARRADADAILTTDKDWAKLARVPASRWPCPVARPNLEIRLVPVPGLGPAGDVLTLVREAAGRRPHLRDATIPRER
jgi:tetraacyldisaccharide 4'-kinase